MVSGLKSQLGWYGRLEKVDRVEKVGQVGEGCEALSQPGM